MQERKHKHITVTQPKLSLKLFNAGLSAESSDNHYWIRREEESGTTGTPRFRFGKATDTSWGDKGREIPAWSLRALSRCAEGILGEDATRETLSRFPDTPDGEKDKISALGKAILRELDEGRHRADAGKAPQEAARTGWPAGEGKDPRPQPFRKKIAAWWRQRPWARNAR